MTRAFRIGQGLTVLLVFLSIAVSAQDNPPERIVVEADALDPEELPFRSTVIGEDEIMAAAPRTAADIIAPLVGTTVQRLGGIMQAVFISIRGSSPEQVLVLVNGKRLNTAQGGGVDLSAIPIDSIERIEVVRGGGSALYGENAVGGIINIITKDGYGKKHGAEISYGWAQANTHRASGVLYGTFGPRNCLDYSLSLTGLGSTGEFTFPDAHSETGNSMLTNSGGLSGGAVCTLGFTADKDETIRFDLSGSAYADRKGVPGIIEFPSTEAVMKDSRYGGRLSGTWKTKLIGVLAADLYGSVQSRRFTDPEAFPDGTDDTHTNTMLETGLSLVRTDGAGFFRFKTAAAYTCRIDHLVSTALAGAGSSVPGDGEMYRTNHSGSLTMQIEALLRKGETICSIFPAVRFDSLTLYPGKGRESVSSTVPSWNVGIRTPLIGQDMLVFSGTFGSAYRLPSFDDLFWPATAFAEGNPDLHPEHGFMWDAGIRTHPLKSLSFEAVYFHNDINDLIQWHPGASGQWRPVNIGRAVLQGLETELKTFFSLGSKGNYLELRANYTLLQARDMTEGSSTFGMILPRRPQEQANLTGTFTHSAGHTFRIEGRYTGFRFITSRNTKFLPSVYVIDASTTIRISKTFTLEISARNLTNARYVDVREFPVPGFELGVELRAAFQGNHNE